MPIALAREKINNKENEKKVYLFILAILSFSCSKKNEKTAINTVECKFDNGISFTIKYHEIVYKDSINYLEINNYKSGFDTIEFNRIPMVYLMIDDDIINNSIFKLKEDNKINYVEYFIDGNSKFQIPFNLLENKSGINRITVAVMDIHFKDNLEELDINDENINVNMGYIEARSAFEINLK